MSTCFGLKFTSLCPKCDKAIIGFNPPERFGKQPLLDENGKAYHPKYVATCAKCGRPHLKDDGLQTYIRRPGDPHPSVSKYHCRFCQQEWKNELKKNPGYR
mgnify:CR=1 FL=1